MIVSDLVRREVRARFRSTDSPDIERLLEATDLPFLHAPGKSRERDRVHLAILLRSDGDVATFARSLALAATDSRDLLVGAGLGNADWPDVLRTHGFPVP